MIQCGKIFLQKKNKESKVLRSFTKTLFLVGLFTIGHFVFAGKTTKPGIPDQDEIKVQPFLPEAPRRYDERGPQKEVYKSLFNQELVESQSREPDSLPEAEATSPTSSSDEDKNQDQEVNF